MFIDSLLIGYQTNRNIEFELERNPMRCTPFRRDTIFGTIRFIFEIFILYFLLESGSIIVTIILVFVDFIFLIPYVKQFLINRFISFVYLLDT